MIPLGAMALLKRERVNISTAPCAVGGVLPQGQFPAWFVGSLFSKEHDEFQSLALFLGRKKLKFLLYLVKKSHGCLPFS